MRTIVLHLIIYVSILFVWMLEGCRQETEGNLPEGFPFKSATSKGWGVMDFSGRRVVPDGTYAFCPSAVVNGMFTVPDGNGTVDLYTVQHPSRPVSCGRYAQIGYFFESVAMARLQTGGPLCIIDKRGEIVAMLNYYPDYRVVMAHNFSEGRALVGTDRGKFGFVDTNGKLVVPPVYDFAADYGNGRALVGKADAEGRLGFFVIDLHGNIRATLRQVWCSFDTAFGSDRLVCRFSSGCYGALDEDGEACFTLPDSILSLSRFRQGRAVARSRSGCCLIGADGQAVMPASYREIELLNADRMALRGEKGWFLADKSGRKIANLEACPLFLTGRGGLMPSDGRMAVVRPDGDVFVVVDSARVSAQALHRKPEVFVRTSSLQETEAEAAVQEPKAPADTSRTAASVSSGAKRNTYIEQTDWKRVAKNHPFYKEAAKVLSGRLQEDDADNRRMILNYVEHLRASYTTKDIDFLNQLFSDDALIIVGHVVKVAPRTGENRMLQDQVRFSVKTKKEYLERLQKVFRTNKDIELKFSDFHISRHPSVKGIYGVTLHQQYRSDRYADDGWLFLLWDFRDKDAPQIHVRTWQPGFLDDKTPLSESEVVNIGQFNLH